MVLEYSDGLKRLIAFKEHTDLSDIWDYNETVYSFDAHDYFLDPGAIRLPSADVFMEHVLTLDLSVADMDKLLQSRLARHLSDRGLDEPNEHLRMLIAIQLTFGDTIWDTTNIDATFTTKPSVSFTKRAAFADYYVNSDGHLSPFGISLSLFGTTGWYETVVSVGRELHSDYRIAELAHLTARKPYFLMNRNINWGRRHEFVRNEMKTVFELRRFAQDDAALAWFAAWVEINKLPANIDPDFLIDVQGRTRVNPTTFYTMVAALTHRDVSLDDAEPYLGTEARFNGEVIAHSAINDIDPELIGSLVS